MGGSSGSTQQQQTSTVQLPPWVSDAAQQNYAFAQQVANQPLVQYQGQQVADVAPATQQAWNLAQTSGNAGAGQFDASTAGALGVLASGSPTITAGSLANTNLSPYMNPYTQDVVNTSLQALEAQRQQSIMGNNATAVASKAFGGSRQGITDAVTNAQSAIGAGQLTSQLQSANFTQAQAAAQSDIANQLAAAQSNQTAKLQTNNTDLAASTQLENLGKDAQNNVLQQYDMLTSAGGQQQTQAQNEINAQMTQFAQAQGYSQTQLNTLLSSLGMTPYGKTQTTDSDTETQYSADPAQAALGLLSIGAGLYKSDKRLKKDIKRIGTAVTSGLPIHSFRFKGQPDDSPKIVGPLAQNVEKKFPAAVTNIGGIKHIIPSRVPGGVPMGILGTRPKQLRRGGLLSAP